MSARFAKRFGYGIRTHNADVDSRSWLQDGKRPCVNVFDVVLQACAALDESIELPMALRPTTCKFTLRRSTFSSPVSSTTALQGLRVSIGYRMIDLMLVCLCLTLRPSRLHEPEIHKEVGVCSFPKNAYWNQLSVEAGFSAECVRKREALDAWENELTAAAKPNALLSGDSLFPPHPARHPKWAYDSGRVVNDARPTTSIPQGP